MEGARESLRGSRYIDWTYRHGSGALDSHCIRLGGGGLLIVCSGETSQYSGMAKRRSTP